jgi:hypothetical protein
MQKITLNDVKSGFNLSAINDNFDQIENALNNNVLYRDNPTGEDNSVITDIDMNGKRIFNLPRPSLPSEPARLIDIEQGVSAVSWDSVNGKPATFVPSIHGHVVSEIAGLPSALTNKQDVLVSGTSIKTLNGQSILGSGDVVISPNAVWGGITGTLADQTDLSSALSGKNPTLVSGTNIKTINGTSVLGSGDLTVSAASEINAAASKTTPADADELGITDSAASWGMKKLTFANLKAWIGGLFVSKSGDTINGNLNFGGTGRRITGDFSNATLANRLVFQTNVANAGTSLGLLPNGTGALSQIILGTVEDGSNDTRMRLYATTTECAIVTDTTGTGSYVDLSVYVGGAARLRIDKTTGSVLSVSGALGYGVGAGGAVSQATSKSTAVTLNKPCGRVTMFNDPTNFPAESAIPAGGEILFQVNNNLVTLTDSVIALPVAASSYLVQVLYVSTGLFVVRILNKTGASLSEQISINFAVIKSTLS